MYSQVDFNLQHNPQYGNSLFVLADIQVVDYLNRILEQVLRESVSSLLRIYAVRSPILRRLAADSHHHPPRSRLLVEIDRQDVGTVDL